MIDILIILFFVCIIAIAAGVIYERREAISEFLDKVIPLPKETKEQRKRKSLQLKINLTRLEICEKENACRKTTLEINMLQEKLIEMEGHCGQRSSVSMAANSGDTERAGKNLQKVIAGN